MTAQSGVFQSFNYPSRRAFLQGIGAMGLALGSNVAWAGGLRKALSESAERNGKHVTLLADGGFEQGAWGWQFTAGAAITSSMRHRGRPLVQVTSNSGDYARFLVLAPEAGKTYTLSGWVKVQNVVASEEGSGAYFAASQFEFQGRPTEFTVDGKQLPEQRFGNFTGTGDWKRFTQSFHCYQDTTWFEVVVGLFRASGTAWFSDLTFVEGETAADYDEAIDLWQAMEMAHKDSLAESLLRRPATAILSDNIPVRGKASDPRQIGKILGEFYDVSYLSSEELSSRSFSRSRFDLLVLPYGESFPLTAQESIQSFLAAGGDLITTGGYAFQSPVLKQNGKWEFYDSVIAAESSANLLPDLDAINGGWKSSRPTGTRVVRVELPGQGAQKAIELTVPDTARDEEAMYSFELPVKGFGKQFFFQGWLSTEQVIASPDGYAYVAIEQLDKEGGRAYAASQELRRLRGNAGWQKIEKLITLIPTCEKLRISFGLRNATGKASGSLFRLESRSQQVRMNTASGFPQDSLEIEPNQIGMFDADFQLRRVASIRSAEDQVLLPKEIDVQGDYSGYAATCVVGMNNARWIPLLESRDSLGRKRGAAGALAHNYGGDYARSSWAFFGVDSNDLFATDSKLGTETLRAVARALRCKTFLHECVTGFACYRDGESVRARVLVSNFGRQRQQGEIQWKITIDETGADAYEISIQIQLEAGATAPISCTWNPGTFTSGRYRVTATLHLEGKIVDRIDTGFVVWKEETLKKGLAFEFKDNYFHVDGKSLFLQGTDDYVHTFINQDENPLTWYEDAQGCRDACIDVYENLMGLRGPQQRPTEAWWRWIDAMLLNVQQAGGAFFPGMLIFSNTAVENKDLADQAAYVKAFANRYKDAAGVMYYLNGDLELHDPNLPDIQNLYQEYLRKKYGTDENLRKAWNLSPPEAPIGKLPIRRGTWSWADLRTLDDFEFRTQVVRRWLNTLHDSIREVDQKHPVTAEFYQHPDSGIDLLSGLGKLELANFGYFNVPDEDYDCFPQVCKLLDQRSRGKGINVGEFGVKTHPAWKTTPDEYLATRTEEYEQSYFLALAHYAFALGASKIQNWSWKYPSDLPFEWGINYPNELIPRDVLAFYRNTGFIFRQLRPRYQRSDVVYLIAGDNRKGGQGVRVLKGILNGIRLLIDQRVSFDTLSDEFISALPPETKTIFYPLSYCPSDEIVEKLSQFVEGGGQLYLSGDISYDTMRSRTRTRRLEELCGVSFVRERYANIEYSHTSITTKPNTAQWPVYAAAPGMVLRLAGANTLVEGANGEPIVTEFRRGRGKVIFSADPLEMHGDPRNQKYAHEFYGALCEVLQLKRLLLEPTNAKVHCFHVPSQDDREISVLVNYGSEARPVTVNVLMAQGAKVQLKLNARMSGLVVGHDAEIEIIESSGDVRVNNKLLLKSNLHSIAASLDGKSLATSKRMVLLPMGEGVMELPEASRLQYPIVLSGEIVTGKWKQYESFKPERNGDSLRIAVNSGRVLSMLVLCEQSEAQESIRHVGTITVQPWQSR